MARVAREKSKTGIYHIVMRGINKQTLFYDDEDKEVFLSRLKIVNRMLKQIMQIEGANVAQISRITGVPYHIIRYLE